MLDSDGMIEHYFQTGVEAYSGYPHLTDFNVAVSVKEGEKTNGFAGTLPYMGMLFVLQLC